LAVSIISLVLGQKLTSGVEVPFNRRTKGERTCIIQKESLWNKEGVLEDLLSQ
jgi:hypothetical protein